MQDGLFLCLGNPEGGFDHHTFLGLFLFSYGKGKYILLYT
jgi:hypothetical protein